MFEAEATCHQCKGVFRVKGPIASEVGDALAQVYNEHSCMKPKVSMVSDRTSWELPDAKFKEEDRLNPGAWPKR